MKTLVWLASYPKSGNTWMRVLLTNYGRDADVPADINRLGGGPIASQRALWEEATGIVSTDLTPEELHRLRPDVYRWLAARHPGLRYLKAHDAYTYLPDGQPLFPPEVTHAAIYIVRNPLDIAVSAAPFFGVSLDHVPAALADPHLTFCDEPHMPPEQLRQHLRSWSGHVTSWVDASEPFPRLVVRYEDMQRAPADTFRRVVEFLGLPYDAARLAKAVRFSAFATLQAQEVAHGFRERPPSAVQFFRQGIVDAWREQLAPAQAMRIIADQQEVMGRFGYLEDASVQALLSAAEPRRDGPTQGVAGRTMVDGG